MSQAKWTARNLGRNWDLALTSSALLVIVGGLAAPHIKRLVEREREAKPAEELSGR